MVKVRRHTYQFIISKIMIRNILYFIRCTKNVQDEMASLNDAKENQSHGLTLKEAIKNLSRYDIRTPFLLTIFSFLSVMFSGPFAIIFYAVEIFQEAGSGVLP